MDRIDIEEITTRVDELRGEKQDLIDTVSETNDTWAEAITARDALAYNGDDNSEYQEAVTAAEEAHQAWHEAMDAEREWRDENSEELAELEALLEEIGGYGGDHQWEGNWYPAELIAEESFPEYAEQLAGDIYSIPDTWPHRCIDWKQAARELKADYSMVTFRGTDYLYRS